MKLNASVPTTVVVVGSINMDISVRVTAIPQPGETVSGSNADLTLGGKGANQAVAASRLGANVFLIGKIGQDAFGGAAYLALVAEKLDLKHLGTSDEVSTGVALITIAENGQNIITVSPGANAAVSLADMDAASYLWTAHTVLLLQNEIPIATSIHAAKVMKKAGGKVLYDPAPAVGFDPRILPFVDVITPNETEAAALTGLTIVDRATALDAARVLVKKGALAAIVKMGSEGCIFSGVHGEGYVDAPRVHAIDTVAAGDCFNGALAVAMAEGFTFEKAIAFACKAAAISVTRAGASKSMPYRHELGS